jgi:HlyD family secretion protein
MRRTKILTAVALLAAVAAGLGFWCPFRNREQTLRLPGVVETQEVRLSSRVGGRICRVAVREGEQVQAGQVLVTLEAPELEARRDQLRAALAEAQAHLAKAEYGAREEEKAAARATVAEAAAKVRRLKAGPRAEEVAAAHADWHSLLPKLERVSRERDREVRLQSGRATRQVDVEVAHEGARSLQEQVKAAEARWQVLVKGTRPEELDQAAAELARAQAQLDLLERGTRPEDIAAARAKVAQLHAQIREVEAQLREAVVVASDPGLVETVPLRRGDTAGPNQPLVRLLRADDLWVKAYAPEPELGKLRLNQEVRVTVDSYSGRHFRGRITHIASVSEFTPRNVQTADERRNQVFALKVRVLESAQVFRSGMAADVHIPLAANPER